MSILAPLQWGAVCIKNPLCKYAAKFYIFGMDKFIDAHCHYNRSNFAGYAGPGAFVCNAACEDDWAPLLAASHCNKRIYAAIGVHPWHVCAVAPGWNGRLREKLNMNPGAMVGEIGLDRTHPDFDRQMSAFVAQMEIAAELNRSAQIHCVHAWDALLRLLKTGPHPKHVVIHRFAAAPEIIHALIEIFGDGVWFSYRAPMRERALRAVAATPERQILVETDGNAPAPDNIRDAMVQIAACLNAAPDYIADITYNNTLRMVNNGQIE